MCHSRLDRESTLAYQRASRLSAGRPIWIPACARMTCDHPLVISLSLRYPTLSAMDRKEDGMGTQRPKIWVTVATAIIAWGAANLIYPRSWFRFLIVALVGVARIYWVATRLRQ